MDLCCLDLKDECAFLKFSGVDITLSSLMAWVHSNRIRKKYKKITFQYTWYIHGIYHVYTGTGYNHGIYMVYTMDIPCIIIIGVPDGVECYTSINDHDPGQLECIHHDPSLES